MVTVEPGIYVPPTSDFPTHFHNIGIRIEVRFSAFVLSWLLTRLAGRSPGWGGSSDCANGISSEGGEHPYTVDWIVGSLIAT